MKIAIDISQVIYETGVSTYTKELVRNLLKLDTDNSYVLYGGSLRRIKDLHDFTNSLEGNFLTKFFTIPPTLADIMWNKLHIYNIENLIGEVDVLHSSDWTQPPTKAFKVTTVHDLVPLLMPEQSHPKIVSAHKKRLEWIKKEIDAVIVPSKSAMSDLIMLGVDSDKITVIPEAPADRFKPQSNNKIKEVKNKYKIEGKYLLAVGNAPRKNIHNIIESFQKVDDVPTLVVVGRGSSTYKNKKNVIFTGHVEDEALPALYSGAEALVYASLYEGFGLPILEAFACECPVVTSNTSSLPEVAGDAAILVDPKDVDDISSGIKKVLRNRQTWIHKGSKRVKEFSWEKTAKETLKIYNQAK